MLKIFAIFGLLLLAVQKPHPAHSSGQQSRPVSQSEVIQQKTPPPESELTKENKDNEDRFAYYRSHKVEYVKFAFLPGNLSNWVLALLGIIGAVVAIVTVSAVRKQGGHIVTSERAWMVAEIELDGIPPEVDGATGIRWTGYSINFVNKGKTPAYLIETGHAAKVLSYKDSLPEKHLPFEEKAISKWKGKGLPLQPNDHEHRGFQGTWAQDPVKIGRGADVLWVYGYIKYRDAFGVSRETWFCRRYVQEIEKYQKSGFIAGGPAGYNHAT